MHGDRTAPATVVANALAISIASVSAPNSLDFYDTELHAHHEHLRAAHGISRGERVVDIGCGTGLTTREAARAAAPGSVVGVDVSERMLERARRVTAAQRLDNVRYELGDAQVHASASSARFRAPTAAWPHAIGPEGARRLRPPQRVTRALVLFETRVPGAVAMPSTDTLR